MNGEHSYRMVSSLQPTSASPSPPTTLPSTPPNDRNLQLPAPKAQRPPTFVAIHQNSNISWVPSPSQNGNGSPVASGSKLKLTLSSYQSVPTTSIVGSQHVSPIQRIPPTQHYNVNGSTLQDISNPNTLVSSSTNNSGKFGNNEIRDKFVEISSKFGTNNSEIPSESVNYKDDIDLDDQGLVTISTKELNRRLKKKGISKSRQKEIKCERRTLKNRGK